MPSSRGSSPPRDQEIPWSFVRPALAGGFLTTSATWEALECASMRVCLSHVQFFVTPWTVAHQASMSMGFSRQEHWSGLPFPSPGPVAFRFDGIRLEHEGPRKIAKWLSHEQSVFFLPWLCRTMRQEHNMSLTFQSKFGLLQISLNFYF